jgi:hypothetical protein
MRTSGKKIGKFVLETVLAKYDLDVRVDAGSGQFSISVPETPGEKTGSDQGRGINYKIFSGSNLQLLKDEVGRYLRERDQTDFTDVIEYSTCSTSSTVERHIFGEPSLRVGFEFRVARVSTSRTAGGRPKLQVRVVVSNDGVVSPKVEFGEVAQPSMYDERWDRSMPFTPDRWRKCVLLREGIAKLREALGDLLDDSREASGKLDLMTDVRMLVPSDEGGFEVSVAGRVPEDVLEQIVVLVPATEVELLADLRAAEQSFFFVPSEGSHDKWILLKVILNKRMPLPLREEWQRKIYEVFTKRDPPAAQ